jgi:hypothetical protein
MLSQNISPLGKPIATLFLFDFQYSTLIFSAKRKRGHSRGEWNGVFESRSASSLASGFAKTTPTRPAGQAPFPFYLFVSIRDFRGSIRAPLSVLRN